MPKYLVSIPIAGFYCREVEAATEADAISLVIEDGFEMKDIEVLEQFEAINEGNVCHAPLSEATAEEA